MSNSSQTVPFTNVVSDFQKLATIPDSLKKEYIDYGSTDFASLRQALITYIKAVYPLDYNNFAESDLGLMLIELVSYMGSVLSLKADMLANENFISTAKERDSVRKLFELVGVSMKGPTSAQATASITVDGVTSISNDLELSPSQRVVTVVSPQDGEALTFTLYSIGNGVVENLNNNASISFTSSLDSSTTYTNGLMLEGAFAVQSGTFSDTDLFKSIVLDEAPVIQNSVQVFINAIDNTAASGAYRQVENLYQASSINDKIFQVVYNSSYKATVIFGDGSNGISPPPLVSYVVTYRVGGGTRGNTPNNYINANGTGSYGGVASTIKVLQTSLGSGGSDAETVDHTKRYGPLTFKRQDRLVSLDDYIAFVNRFTSPVGTTGKATAVTRKAFCSANVIDLYVLEKASNNQYQKASLSFKNALLTDIELKKMITDDIVVVDGLVRTVDLVVTVNIDKRYEGQEGTITPKVADIIQNYFLVDNWGFGDPLILQDLNRVMFEMDEVRFSSIDNLVENIHVEFNEIVQLNNVVINVNLV